MTKVWNLKSFLYRVSVGNFQHITATAEHDPWR